MKRKLLSLVCALALTISLLPAAQALEGEGTRAAEALASLGLVTGTGAGYAAEDAATQEQAAALLVRLLGAEKAAKADRRSCSWAGVPAWARSAVNYCAFHDLIDWSEYHAGGALDAELWCAMLLRALGCGSELGSSTARTALRIGLISRPLEGTLTRGDLFETALAALTYPAKDGGTLLDEYGRAVAVTTGAYVYGNNMYLCVPLDPVLEADLTGEGMTLQEVLDAVTAAREAAAEAAEADESR